MLAFKKNDYTQIIGNLWDLRMANVKKMELFNHLYKGNA